MLFLKVFFFLRKQTTDKFNVKVAFTTTNNGFENLRYFLNINLDTCFEAEFRYGFI